MYLLVCIHKQGLSVSNPSCIERRELPICESSRPRRIFRTQDRWNNFLTKAPVIPLVRGVDYCGCLVEDAQVVRDMDTSRKGKTMNNRPLAVTLAICTALLSGCATVEETYAPDGSIALIVDCSTTNVKIMSWGDCQKKAGEICHKRGYRVISQNSDSIPSRNGSADQAIRGQYDSAAVWGNLRARTIMIRCLGDEPSEPRGNKTWWKFGWNKDKGLLDRIRRRKEG